MQLTKYNYVGSNLNESLNNALIVSKTLKTISDELVPYMKNVLLNANLVLYNGVIHIRLKSSVHTEPFLNTIEFKTCLGLTNRPKLHVYKPKLS
jgi:hypothetical protein